MEEFYSHKRHREEETESEPEPMSGFFSKRSRGSYEDDENLYCYTIGKEIHFSMNIDKTSIQTIIRQITKLVHEHISKNEDKKEKETLNITYIVDSPGGSVTSILKFVDFINMIKKKYPTISFTSVITGLVASAGTIMAIVADKRLITKNAHAMIHELSSGNSGKYTELQSHLKFLNNLHEKLVNIYCEKTGKTRDAIEFLMRKETWFTAEEYAREGFAELTGK